MSGKCQQTLSDNVEILLTPRVHLHILSGEKLWRCCGSMIAYLPFAIKKVLDSVLCIFN